MDRLTSDGDYCDTYCDKNKNKCPVYNDCINRLCYEKLRHYEKLEEEKERISSFFDQMDAEEFKKMLVKNGYKEIKEKDDSIYYRTFKYKNTVDSVKRRIHSMSMDEFHDLIKDCMDKCREKEA